MLGLFSLFSLFQLFVLFQVPKQKPREQEKTDFDQLHMFDETGSDDEMAAEFIYDQATIGIVKSKIRPGCKGQIEFDGWIWTAASFQNAVFEKNEQVRVIGRHQLTYIVKKLPRSLCSSHSLN